MRKSDFYICENKDADQLCGNHAANQRLCFRYTYSTIPLLPMSQAIFCGCIDRFVSDLVGKPEDRFSREAAHLCMPRLFMCGRVRLYICDYRLNTSCGLM